MYFVLLFCATVLATLEIARVSAVDAEEVKRSGTPVLLEEAAKFSLTPFDNERKCASQGGICVEEKLCPTASLADKADENKFLCPAQKSKGAACCFGLPEKQLPCGMRGGFCRERCGHALQADPLGICPDPTGQGGTEGTVCCPLLL